MATNEKLKNQLTNRKESAPVTPEQTVEAYMKKMAPRMAEVLPKHMDMNRMSRIALTTIRTNPKLLECAVPSLMGAVMQAVQLGLEPGLLGHCYILPYKREATFIIGYKGMIDLARRSGHIQSIYAHAVHENDEFEYELGLHPKLEHKPSHGDRGAFIGAYAVAHFKDGGYQMEFMPKSEIEKRRKRSAAANSSYSPWSSDYEEMAKKTVVRYMFKYLPISIEVQTQAQQDEVVRKDITEEPEFIEVDPIEGEQVITEDAGQQEFPIEG
ncbi:recombination protein RecT [Bacillus thuringiensis]|jgi:recombination protein RecT|uniref:Recombination protein RecT n=3 Tax=Bacillus thuringiensis TaxID=1428 RepID=A0AB35PL76_BACTU|nr:MULTISPECIES: recombination protein RecT [Bacillus]MED1153247.1 recombination protein RecT [Bacillus paranthracis]AFQ27342.1 recombination and repair protein RecT [Bacillus thuringiensis HD-789]AJH08830.1 protein recT [Bacillus thuringiensis HD1002]AND25408.1 recombinase RecT [Bacillus thuringiensis serovar israelensis]EEN01983.1 DNA-binding phage-related protein [Bacillus thuringiensis IBL 4222]